MYFSILVFPAFPQISAQYEKYGKFNELYIKCKAFLFRKCLVLYNIVNDFDIWFLMHAICGFQQSLLSIITPRNLVSQMLNDTGNVS